MAIRAFSLFGDIELKGGDKTLTGLKNISTQVNRTEKDLGRLRGEIDKTSKSHSNFSQGFLSSFGIQRGQGIGALAGNQAGNLLQYGIQKLTGHLTDAMQRGMEFADQIQQWKIAFENLLGSKEAGNAHLRELIKYGKESPFETEDVVNYSQQLESVGIKAKEAIPALEAIGGMLARAGHFNPQALEGSILAITQMLGKDQISAEEMTRQLSQYIPNPYGLAAKGFNRLGYRTDSGAEFTGKDIRQLGEDKRLNAEAFVRVLLDEMGFESKGMLDKIVANSQMGQKAILEDVKSQLFAKSMMGTQDLLGDPGGAYKQYLENLKIQQQIYGGPQAQKIGAGLGMGAQLYYGAMGFGEQHMFDANMLLPGMVLTQQLLPMDKAKQLGATIGQYLPEGMRQAISDSAQGLQSVIKSVMGDDMYKALTTFWETNSPSKKTIQLGLWLAEGLELGLTKGQGRNYANFKALTQADPNFIKTLAAEAAKRGVNADDMLNLISIESGFNKSVMNQYGYGGLGQVGRDERSALGLPANDAAFKQMLEANTASWQLQHVLFPFLDMKLAANKGVEADGISLAELYAMWGSGHATGNPNAIHMAKGGMRARAYANNPLWDFNHDGVVRESEFGQAAMASLGAGKFFSVNGQAAVTKTNPMPVQIVDFGNSVVIDPNTMRPLNGIGADDTKFNQQLTRAIDAYTARRSSRGGGRNARTLVDDVPVSVDAIPLLSELTTTFTALDESALNLKKPLDLLGDSAAAAATGLTKEGLESEYGALITDSKKKKRKRDKLYDDVLTREGIATDFQADFQQALMNPFKKSSWGNFGKDFLRDIQGRAAHDLSSSLTEMIFGHRKGGEGADANSLVGGLLGSLFGGGKGDGSGGGLGGLLKSLFGSLFGGHRASGGPVEPGRFYRWQEPGTGGEWLFAGDHGHIMNRSQMQRTFGGGAQRQRIILVDDERAAEEHYNASDANLMYRIRRNQSRMARIDRYH